MYDIYNIICILNKTTYYIINVNTNTTNTNNSSISISSNINNNCVLFYIITYIKY